MIHAKPGSLEIVKAEMPLINADLATWDAQFKAAKKKGDKPEMNLLDGMTNEFDLNEW